MATDVIKMAMRTTCIQNVKLKINYQNKDKLSVCRMLSLQRKPKLGRGLDIADLESPYFFQYLMYILAKFNTFSRPCKPILKFNSFSIPCGNPVQDAHCGLTIHTLSQSDS